MERIVAGTSQSASVDRAAAIQSAKLAEKALLKKEADEAAGKK